MAPNLGLDEALISIKRAEGTPSLGVFYQIDECYGCRFEKLTQLDPTELEKDFKIGTKYKLAIKISNSDPKPNDIKSSCMFPDLSLSNHGHYKIDVSSSQSSNATSMDCNMHTLYQGDCDLCPLALVFCILLGTLLIERLYEKMWPTKSARDRGKLEAPRPSSSQRRESQLSGNISQQSEMFQQTSHEDTKPIAETDAHESPPREELPSTSAERSAKDSTTNRVESLDIFRGITIAGMILVNYGGAGYVFLDHKPWDGITVADFVFPFFIFSMGASTAISTGSMAKRGSAIGVMTKKILRRSLILMAIGLCLNSKWLNGLSLHYLRLTGVLQRFSISYLVVAIMYAIKLLLEKWLKSQSISRVRLVPKIMCGLFEAITALNYTAIYIYVTFYLDYSSNCPPGYTGPGGQTEGGRYENCTGGAAAWLDQLVLSDSHIYHDNEVKRIFKTKISHDPEGILGYTTSILLTLIGLQCGKALINSKTSKARILAMVQWLVLLAAASSSAIAIPINKRLWSFSFVTVTGTCAFLLMIILYALVDIYNCRRVFMLRLLSSAGKNAIFLYVGHSLLNGMLPWYFAVDQTSHMQLLLRLSWAVFVWLLVAQYMAMKGLFIRI